MEWAQEFIWAFAGQGIKISILFLVTRALSQSYILCIYIGL